MKSPYIDFSLRTRTRDSLNEKELEKSMASIPSNSRGIDKLEFFLENNNATETEIINFFRNVQRLRSSTVAHRRSINNTDTKKSWSILELMKQP